MEYKCKCEKLFCIAHLHAEEHNCNFDYKKEGQYNQRKQIDKGPLTEKVSKI